MIGPIPGMASSRRLTSLLRCRAPISSSIPSACFLQGPKLGDEGQECPARDHRRPRLRLVLDGGDQRSQAERALALDDPEPGQVAAQGVAEHRPLPDQEVARPVQHQRASLRLALDRHGRARRA
jgi:hypothetical protein